MNITFKPALSEHIEYLLGLRVDTMNEHLKSAGIFLSDSEHLARVKDNFEHFFLIYKMDNLIGAIKLVEHENSLEIMQLQIHPQFQGIGLGRQVMNKVILQAGGKSVVLNVLKQNPAKRLYLKLGFEVIGEDDFEYHMKREVRLY